MANSNQETITMLVSFFNMRAGTRCWAVSQDNINACTQVIEKADSVAELKMFLGTRASAGEKSFKKACLDFADAKDIAAVKEVEKTPAPTSGELGMLERICVSILSEMKLDSIVDATKESLRRDVMDWVIAQYGPIRRKVEFEFGERRVQLDGVAHKKFDTIIKFVQAGEPVFLEGPAGSGKNVLCQQIAKVLGLNFYFSNAVTQEYKLTGFTDANGTYHESQFYKAFKYGGLFMLDEMDASIPEVLIILNAAIANRYFDFPAPIGYVEAHPDFHVIAAGNTFGNGADYDYVGRNQLDAASLDRFAVVKVDYDPQIEESCANGDNDLLKFCRAFRAAANEAGIRVIVSYRAISRMAKLSACMKKAEILDTCLIKGLELDSLNILDKSLSGCGLWTAAFKAVLAERRG